MPKICYRGKKFTPDHTTLIGQANAIIGAYQAQGFTLTLRQLYYQFVARALIPNKTTEYNRLGEVISDARLAGEIDWDAIEDRLREVEIRPSWSDAESIVEAVAQQFHADMWEGQHIRPEVWIEKDALVGVIEGVCRRYDVPYFACRGYASQSSLWRAGRRLRQYAKDGQKPLVIHLGDHDPSGIDMTRDNEERLSLFAEQKIVVRRVALNMNQIIQYNPPPNPAKVTDSRYESYQQVHGTDSWELDALDPAVIAAIVEKEIKLCIRQKAAWQGRVDFIAGEKADLSRAAGNWAEVVAHLAEIGT